MTPEQNREYIRDILATLAFAPAYLDTLARTPPLEDTPHLDRLRAVAEAIADLLDRVPEVLAASQFTPEREHATTDSPKPDQPTPQYVYLLRDELEVKAVYRDIDRASAAAHQNAGACWVNKRPVF